MEGLIKFYSEHTTFHIHDTTYQMYPYLYIDICMVYSSLVYLTPHKISRSHFRIYLKPLTKLIFTRVLSDPHLVFLTFFVWAHQLRLSFLQVMSTITASSTDRKYLQGINCFLLFRQLVDDRSNRPYPFDNLSTTGRIDHINKASPDSSVNPPSRDSNILLHLSIIQYTFI